MKRILSVLLALTFVLILSACSGAQKGVSMEQIETNISELSVVTNGVIQSEYTPSVPYTVDSVEIEKRQTNVENKEDIVYCNVVISNEYYQTNLLIKLVYNYYDEGGWCLEENNLEDYTSKPLIGVDVDMVFESMKKAVAEYDSVKSGNAVWQSYVTFKGLDGNRHSLSQKYSNITLGEQKFNSENYSTYINVNATSSLTKLTGYIEFAFDNKEGFIPINNFDNKKIVVVVDTISADYAEACQKFSAWYGRYAIEKIDVENETISLRKGSINSSSLGETTTIEFDVYSGSFAYPYTFNYSPSQKTWIYNLYGDWYTVTKND